MVDPMVSSAFAPLIGQTQAIELLTQAVVQNRVAPAYLFTGSQGIGRGLAAQCFAELLLSTNPLVPAAPSLRHRIQQGNHPDLLWVEPTYLHQGKLLSSAEAAEVGLKRKTPPLIRLEQIRQIARFLSRPPLEAPRSVVVLNQAETMPEPAANGLLKTLEEPGRATLILLAPSTDALLPTLVSRCQRIPFYRLSEENLSRVLTQAGHEEILRQPQVLAIAQGSPGEAIASWQQLQTIPSELLEAATQIPRSLRAALELARQIDKTLDAETQLWLITYLQHRYWQAHAQPSLLQQLEAARQHLLKNVQPRLVWEVTLMAIADS
jgi:DNA polymerase-3 subunit delta'